MKVRKLIRRGCTKWVADLGIVEGHRVSRTWDTEDEARGWLERKRQERKALGDSAISFPDAKRIEYLSCEQRLAGTATISEAVEFFLQYRKAIVPCTVKAAIAARVESMRLAGRRLISIKACRSALCLLLRGCDDRLVSDIRQEELQAAIARDGAAVATRRSRTVNLRAFFNFCFERQYLLTNIADRLERPRQEDAPPKILTASQTAVLFKVACKTDPDLAANLALVAFGGLRPMEAQRLPKESLSGGQVLVMGDVAKTRRRRIIEPNPALRAWLKVGNPIAPRNFWNRLLAIRRAANVPWWQDCLRHSFCSYSVAQFGARWTAEQAGHSEAILFKVYRELVTKSEAKRYWSIRP